MHIETLQLGGLLWKIRRLRAMDIDEVVYRLRQAAQVQWEKRGLRLARYEEPMGEGGKAWRMEPAGDFDASLYAAAADRTMEGRFKLFALRDERLGFPPDWNRDPKSGIDVPLVFGKSIDYRDETVVGDIKYLWELNRHLDLVTLAQAYHLTGNKRYADGAQDFLESWIEQCPYPRGPNWTSSLELAFRLVNWACAWHLLGGTTSVLFEGERGERFKKVWLESVYRHLHFVRSHLSHHSSANNHLIGEYTGLFIGATTWPLWKECREWTALAKSGLEDEALRQNGFDGVNREQAVWYEHEVADMLLQAGLAGRTNGIEFSEDYWARLTAILEHIASIMDVAGQVPMFGDADDAVLVRYSQEPDFDAYRSLLATGAVLFERGDFKAKARCFDDKSRWLLGDAAGIRFEGLPDEPDKLPVRREFPMGGYWILGDKFETADEIRIVADAGPLGYLSIAAHGHADALSFVLSAQGREILVDPGTCAYHTREKWRNYFRGTSSHNTVRVDGKDQSVAGGKFLWLNHARAQCHRFNCSADYDEWEASHDGYLRLSEPVRHRRRIVFNKHTAEVEVTDTLEGAGHHSIEIFWHFAEGCSVSRANGEFEIRHDEVTVTLSPPLELDGHLTRGTETPPLGWISRRFDEKEPTTTLICEGHVEGTTSFRTRIRFEDFPTVYH